MSKSAFYRHYKGGKYRFLTLALMESDLSEVVVYQNVDGSGPWVRPSSDFFGKIDDGRLRFEPLEDAAND